MQTRACVFCQDLVTGGERFVLVRGSRQELHCSQTCLLDNLKARRRARAAWRRRWILRGAALAVVLIGAPTLWHRFRLPRAQSIAYEAPDFRPAPPPRPKPVFEGPAWPPTDDDWLFAFRNTAWVYPLPGPVRHRPTADDRILGAATGGAAPACREPGRCGVDLGGDLWGEHVYAVHDGVIDQVHHVGGDVSLRIVHFSGMVFSHYFHLAAVPRNIHRGAEVRAGELIGAVGDSGSEHPGRYVHFALSIRPSPRLPEVYWDPSTLMATWPLSVPPHGTVAGFVASDNDLPVPLLRHRSR